MVSRPVTAGVQAFVNQYQLEEKARDLYLGYEKEFSDPKLLELFKFIRQQEEGHMQVAQELLQLVGGDIRESKPEF